MMMYNMINKNEWSLRTFSERDINLKILSISPVVHTQESFTKMLSLKECFEREGVLPRAQIILRVLNARPKRKEQQQSSNLCSSCYEELPSHKHWCRICGGHTCKKCLLRERELKDETRTLFCDKCDQQYLQAMSAIAFFNEIELLQRAFTRLVKEQQAIEDLVAGERVKLLQNGRGSAASDLVSRAARASQLSQQNRTMKTQCVQLQKKLQFGRSINKDLKKKLHALRKKQKESFGTVSSNADEYNAEIDPPKLELDMTLQNLRDSIITTEEHAREELSFMDKCKCVIY